MHYYTIRHMTNFIYSEPISESVMELRMQPLTKDRQRCLNFHLRLSPKAKNTCFKDGWGNNVHHFDVANRHTKLSIGAAAYVSLEDAPVLPDVLPLETWEELDHLKHDPEYFDWLYPSRFVRPSDALYALQTEWQLARTVDPLTFVRQVNAAMYGGFDYETGVTEVDSPIEDALAKRHGVCQDFVHIMLTLLRETGIPARYVSGYLFHRVDKKDRSVEDATHAWLEAWLPSLGWVGFDPTNNLICKHRHIRVGVGRDYADVPPTRGVFKGQALTTLEVAVEVLLASEPPAEIELAQPTLTLPDNTHSAALYDQQHQQQ